MSNLEGDLNSVIANAVNARIEAQVAEALSGDAVIGQFVTAALQQPVEVDRYSNKKTTYVKQLLDKAIKEATQAAVKTVITEYSNEIEAAIRGELLGNINEIAKGMVGSMTDAANGGWRIQVDVQKPKEY